jgi:hypothetical protein
MITLLFLSIPKLEESPSKIPLRFALDVIHGWRTVFPVPTEG